MFHPVSMPMERGWVGRVEGDEVVHLAAQTLQHVFTGGGKARDHARYPLADVTLLAPLPVPPSIRVFDENGGFYDTVAPPTVPDNNVNPNPGPHPDYSRLGFRVSAIAMGPFAPKKFETAGPYEHCSILRMIEWRWGLQPMTMRDAKAKNLAEALDFTRRRDPITLPDFTPPPVKGCPNPQISLA